jgi:tungstate transport system ATP-binding protein
METLLQIRNLVFKDDGITILDLPELCVNKGEVLVLLGPNGAGKSTLLHVAAGLKKATSGKIQFTQSHRLSDLDYRRKVSTVFQSPLLLSDTVEKNIAIGLRFRGLPAEEINARTQRWMDLLHISHLAKRRANVLSGGEAQRVSLARAFCLETELILMDEPFSALDTPTRLEMLDDIRNIFSRTNQTCIYVTHDQEEALTIGDRVAIFFHGKLHQLDTTQNIFTHPATPEVAAFMGMDNIIPGRVINRLQDLLQIESNEIILETKGKVEIGTQVYICLRPEDITLYNTKQTMVPSSASNQLTCRIKNLVNQGPFLKIQLESKFPLTALATRSSVTELELEIGKEIQAKFKTTAIHLIIAEEKR